MSVDVLSIALGAGIGAAIRYFVVDLAFSTPVALLLATLASVFVAFLVLGIVLGAVSHPYVRAGVAGGAGAIGSMSGFTALGISQPAQWAIPFVILTPVVLIAGLFAGAVCAVKLKSSSPTSSSDAVEGAR
jgi:fluoride ion exporter CrcB/FEX